MQARNRAERWRAARAVMLGLLAGFILAIGGGGASAAAGQCGKPPETMARFEPSKEPSVAPDAAFTDEKDQERTLASFRGTALVVNFWATWCAPCVKEMPALDALAKQLGQDGIAVLALSADREGAPVVRKFYEKNEITSLEIAIDRMSRVARALGINGLPTTVLFDAAGREVGRVVGVAEWDAPATVGFLRGCLDPAA